MTELAKTTPEAGKLSITGGAATPAVIRDRVNFVQRVMADIMIEDVHYGTIPGTPKPTLLKPGAEKLLMAFGVHVTDPQVFDLGVGGAIRYRVVVHGTTADGTVVGTGVGECSSDEKKYKWRRAVCDEEWQDTPEALRNKKWKDDGTYDKQIRAEPADIANTILKMSKKRALVDLCLTALAASDCFEQDLDDPDHPGRTNGRQKRRQRAQKPTGGKHQGAIKSVTVKKEGTSKAGKPWAIYAITADDGTVFETFSEQLADDLRGLAGTGEVVSLEYTVDKKYNTNKLEGFGAAESGNQPATDGEITPRDVNEARKAAGVSIENVQNMAKLMGFGAMQSKNWTAEECARMVDVLGDVSKIADLLGPAE